MSKRPDPLQLFAILVVPVVLVACALSGARPTAALSFGVLIVSLILSFASYEHCASNLSEILPTVALAALAAAGRILFAPFPDVKPLTAIVIVAGASLGPANGFMAGALATLSSNFFFGQGAYTPWQMYAWGLIGWLAGILTQAGLLHTRRQACIFGFISALLYGFILNSWHVIGFVRPLTPTTALAAYAAGLPLDLIHGAATVVFVALIWESWTRKIRRIRTKY